MDSTQINNSNTLEALDCISRQAAIDALFELSRNTAFDIPAEPNATKYYRDALYDACQLIKSLPPVQPNHNADVSKMEIIHCKDCKFYGRADKRRFYRGSDCLNKHIDTIVPDRDFCSRAEKRGEAE